MGSLKEIKVRIASIRSTQKITAAMKMVSSAKFHHAQTQTEHTLTYANKLSAILNGLLSAECDLDSPYTEQRKVSKVAIAVFASSTGLCGTFNANIWKELSATIQTYKNQQIEVGLYPIGKKIADELHKAGYSFDTDFVTIGEKPSYESAVSLANRLMELFVTGKADRVELLYHHFKNMATQVVTHKTYLPLSLSDTEAAETATDYILEPSAEELRNRLFPKLLNLTIYTILLDTSTAEHAARMMAMQTANDNANDLIQQLTLQYNKTRQQGYSFDTDFVTIGEKPSYESAVSLANRLMELFVTGKADRVELLYHHFKNMATQVVTHKTYLPLSLSDTEAAETATDYILEPSAEELRNRLFPKLLNLTIYTILLDTSTAEHAARMMAMQTANDNANDLIQQLTLQYNKTRQQAITNELLDIMGGAAVSS